MGARNESRHNNADLAEKQVEAYNLRLRGHSLRDIGKLMGVSHTAVANWIKLECDQRVLPLADEVRKQEIDRFDNWLLKLAEQIDDGKQVARNIEVAVKVSERRARLLGADAPIQTEVAATVEHKPTEVLALLEQTKARVAAEEAALREGRQRVEAEAREEYGPA